MSLHEKVKAEHFYLNPRTKTRNHLAEEVLNQNMSSLMKVGNVNNCKQPRKEWLSERDIFIEWLTVQTVTVYYRFFYFQLLYDLQKYQ